MRGELNAEEQEALEGLVSEQADALKDGELCPLCPAALSCCCRADDVAWGKAFALLTYFCVCMTCADN